MHAILPSQLNAPPTSTSWSNPIDHQSQTSFPTNSLSCSNIDHSFSIHSFKPTTSISAIPPRRNLDRTVCDELFYGQLPTTAPSPVTLAPLSLSTTTTMAAHHQKRHSSFIQNEFTDPWQDLVAFTYNNNTYQSHSPTLSFSDTSKYHNTKTLHSIQRSNSAASDASTASSCSTLVLTAASSNVRGGSHANINLYKTEFCSKFRESGSCPFGEKCQFVHHDTELQRRSRALTYKTRYCWSGPNCAYQRNHGRCIYLHGDETAEMFDQQRGVSFARVQKILSEKHQQLQKKQQRAWGKGMMTGVARHHRSMSAEQTWSDQQAFENSQQVPPRLKPLQHSFFECPWDTSLEATIAFPPGLCVGSGKKNIENDSGLAQLSSRPTEQRPEFEDQVSSAAATWTSWSASLPSPAATLASFRFVSPVPSSSDGTPASISTIPALSVSTMVTSKSMPDLFSPGTMPLIEIPFPSQDMINEWKDRCFEEDEEKEQRRDDAEKESLGHGDNHDSRLGLLNIDSSIFASNIHDSSGNDDSSLSSASCSTGRTRTNPFAFSLSWSAKSPRSSKNSISPVGPYRLW